MDFQSFSEKDFLVQIENSSIEEITIDMMIYHNFEQPPDKTTIHGKYKVEIENPSQVIVLNDNPSSLAQSAYPPPTVETFANPYPTQNVAYPGPNVLSVTPSLIPTDEPKLASLSIEISVDGLMPSDR